ncbi:MAG: ribosome silencing factor [Gammaproteobacteria bacterium]|nr:ribosome silencing factor [Gammaproteobacteria bacterium]
MKNTYIEILNENKALDICSLDVSQLSSMTENMVICTATSNRHGKSLANKLVEKAKDMGNQPLGVEGLDEASWILIDLNNVIVHIMLADTRKYYQLEKLWTHPSQ